ncbi:hypothetical protein K9N50_11995 [bacterium]|nr:hypothetical protein [bacterium]
MHKYIKYIIAITFITYLIIGCEGEIGKDGVNRIPDDVQAPYVELILPEASRPVYDKITFEAFADDDVGVVGMEFLIDGQSLPTGELTLTEEPWQAYYGCSHLNNGAHYFQAVARDGSGRLGFSPMVMVEKMDISNKPVFDTLKSYIELDDNKLLGWTLPDEYKQYTCYGTRFVPDGPCTISFFAVKAYTYEDWQCTRPISFEIRSSRNNLPDSLIYADTTNWTESRFSPGEIQWFGFNIHEVVVGRKIRTEGDFFVIVNLANEQVGDTIGVLTDNGQWRNYHGVAKKDGEWEKFTGGSRFSYNPLIWAKVKYE